ncbi:transcriptional repressor [Myxacorys almedinensis A]|uniref:Transcriptional repressor n=2 Tax=Myxacorys TaxID=2056239 RepID=A0A8J7Z8F6_9CYAN|nr:Fur family transcriptional regulator [Myxacorys almedinensis]NDJ19841.1 transcriptional repressor [Myxacorys almedinensis A]
MLDDSCHLPLSTIRLTTKQKAVLTQLERLQEAVSAQQLYTELRQHGESLGLATVYRALELLKLRGLVQSRTTTDGEALYSPIQQDQHYLTCLQCGSSVPLGFCPLQEMENQLRRSQAFTIYYHTLEFFGVCKPCGQKVEKV